MAVLAVLVYERYVSNDQQVSWFLTNDQTSLAHGMQKENCWFLWQAAWFSNVFATFSSFYINICTFIVLCIILLLGLGVLVMLLIQYLSASQAKHNDFYYRNESHTWLPSVLWQCWLGSRKRSGMYTDCCMLTTVNWRMQMICTYFGVLVVSHYF